MPESPELAIQKATWQQVRRRVSKINPELTAVIDEMDPGNEYVLYIAQYSFGSEIVHDGIFHLPKADGSLIPIYDESIPAEIRNHLNYNDTCIPLGFSLEKTIEIHTKQDSRCVPFALMNPGKFFALWSVLGLSPMYLSRKLWNVTAGARNTFVLPKITDSSSYKQLSRTLKIKTPMPRSISEHALMFKQIINKTESEKPWRVEILFFSHAWLKEKPDNNWIKFHRYLLIVAWAKSDYWRNKFSFDYVWDCFIKELADSKVQIKPHAVDIVKHLIVIAAGIMPGFSPATNEETLPLNTLQQHLVEIYKLKHYSPTIIIPTHFALTDQRPVYWSFQLPSHFNSTPKKHTKTSTISEMREIHNLLSSFYHYAANGKLKDSLYSKLYNLVRDIKFDFFHNENDPDEIIRSSHLIPVEDEHFTKACLNQTYNKRFSEVSPFVRGCIRISANFNAKDSTASSK